VNRRGPWNALRARTRKLRKAKFVFWRMAELALELSGLDLLD
jgi:hypothetical protein